MLIILLSTPILAYSFLGSKFFISLSKLYSLNLNSGSNLDV